MIARTGTDASPADLPLAELTLAGPDAAAFLQGYLTCDMDAIEEGAGSPMAYCNLKGRVLASGWASGRADRVGLVVHASLAEALSAHLSKYLVFSRSKLERGPNRALAATPANGALELRPRGWTLAPPAASGPFADLDRGCIDAGFAVVSAPVSERFLPQMLGLTDIGAVNFEKGCYLGQEVVARAQYRGEVKRRIRRYRYRGERPAPGAATSPSGMVVHAAADDGDGGLALVVTGSSAAELSGPDCTYATI